MIYRNLLLFYLVGLFSLFSCNPDCENFARVEAIITPRFDLPEEAYLITTIPSDFLIGRELYAEKAVNGELVVNESTKVTTTPMESGYMVKRSELLDGNFNFYVRDNDCGGFIPFNTTYQCDVLSTVQTEVLPRILVPGQEILVRSDPFAFLEEKDLYIQSLVNGIPTIDENAPLLSRFSAEARGRIATIPRDAVGATDIFIKDDNCGGFIPLSSVRVANEEFINSNLSSFVIPSPPQIIIPTPPVNIPTNIVNTWFSPNNRNYCIWFRPELARTETGCYREKENLVPGNTDIGPGTPQSGSWELKAGCGDDPNAFLFDANPITGGVIDTLTGYVSFAIDRTSKGLGIERFEGSLMNPTSVQEDYQIVGACVPHPEGLKAKLMMVVTSEQTGRQLILYRFDAIGLEFHGRTFCKTE